MESPRTSREGLVKDSNGNILNDGDSVIVIRQLPVKGGSGPIKIGAKVKNIKLVEAIATSLAK
jgi:protein PhnA